MANGDIKAESAASAEPAENGGGGDDALLQALLNVQRELLAAKGDLDALLHGLISGAMAAVAAADGVILELLDGDALVYRLAVGAAAEHVGLRLPLDRSLSGHALRTGQALLFDDVAGDPRTDAQTIGKLGIRSMILAPLFRRGAAFGVLKLHSARPGVFRTRHLLAAQMLANLASATVTETAELALEHKAAAAEARYRSVIDSADDTGVIGTDAAGRVTSWSRGAETIFGWTEAEMLGQTTERIYTPEDRRDDRPGEEMREAAASGRAADERWHQRKDGSRFFGHGALTPLQGPDLGFVKSVRDITAEHETHAALAGSRERLEIALDTGLIGFFEWDVEQGRLTGDARWASFYGLDAATAAQGVRRDRLIEMIHPADRRTVIDSGRAAAAGADLYTLTYRVTGCDQRTRWLLVRGRRLTQAEGSSPRFFGVAVDVTVQQEAEAELKLSQDRLELAMRSAGLGSFDYYPQTGLLTWDDRCRELFGLSAGAPVSYETAFLAGLHPEDREWVTQAVAAALDPDLGGEFDVGYRTVGIEDGVERCVAARGLAFFQDRTPVRLIGTVLDVTVARREQRALRETEERLRLAARATNDVIWDWDLASDRILWNEALASVYGHVLRESSEAWWLEQVHPDERWRVEQDIRAVIDGSGSDWSDSYRFRRADGGYADVRDRGYVIRDGAGRAVRMIGAMLDESERKAVERALERAKLGLEQTVEARTRERDQIWRASPDLLCVASFDGWFKEINPAWGAALGWTDEELRSQPFAELIHPQDRQRTAEAMSGLASGEEVFGFENRYRTKSGAYRWLSWNAAPRDGLIYAVVRDVTIAHEQAEALAAAEEQLRQSQKMEAVGQLTGGIAHDFNNLLAGISGSLEMMQTRLQQGRAGEIDRYIAAAQGAARRAAALTHRLLAFSRRQTLTPQVIDANKLVAGMEELIRRTIGPEIALETAAADGLWLIQIDPNQLENALLNLCINARDAMTGGGELMIETANHHFDERTAAEHELAPGPYVSLCVTDTGAGMSKAVMARAFDPFFTTKPIGQGTGLGLSMTYGFVRQSGGQVRISSEEGQGSTVCLYLPRHLGEGEPDVAPGEDGRAMQGASAGETVLVVDDEATVRMLVVDALEELGYAAIEAEDAAGGLAALQSAARIDLLITDVGLPGGVNGRQLAESARQARPELKVLFITGYAENAVLSHGHLEPGMQVLTKPFPMDVLGARIRAIIET